MMCLMTQLPCVQLTKTVCGGSSGWLLLQAPFSQLAVQEKGAQAWMALPTEDVLLTCLLSGALLMPLNVNLWQAGQSG